MLMLLMLHLVPVLDPCWIAAAAAVAAIHFWFVAEGAELVLEATDFVLEPRDHTAVAFVFSFVLHQLVFERCNVVLLAQAAFPGRDSHLLHPSLLLGKLFSRRHFFELLPLLPPPPDPPGPRWLTASKCCSGDVWPPLP